jgi:3-phenylpropionate/trans-cinnamate dioxygenase ferredoxin reductase subunit
LPDGLVSRELGLAIKPGHAAHVQGPFGQAYLREGDGPLILISGGAGWAPIWALARMARFNQRERELIVIAGSRDAENLYMRPALDWLVDDGVREVIATSETGASDDVKRGLPTHYVPLLGLEDTVHVAGPIGLVDAIKSKALDAHARCFADPFLASPRTASLADRIARKWQSFELFGRREA